MAEIFSLERAIKDILPQLKDKWDRYLRDYWVVDFKGEDGKDYRISIAKDEYVFFWKRYTLTIRRKGQEIEARYASSKLKPIFNQIQKPWRTIIREAIFQKKK